MTQPRSIEERLCAAEARLELLEDIEAVRNLVASYGPLADSGNAEAVAALWQPDGEYAVGGFGAHRGREAIGALIRAEHHQQMMQRGCAHVLSPLQVTVDGLRAVAVGYSCVFLRSEDCFEVYRVSSNRWELHKDAEGWRVSQRTNRLLDGDEAARLLLGVAGS